MTLPSLGKAARAPPARSWPAVRSARAGLGSSRPRDRPARRRPRRAGASRRGRRPASPPAAPGRPRRAGAARRPPGAAGRTCRAPWSPGRPGRASRATRMLVRPHGLWPGHDRRKVAGGEADQRIVGIEDGDHAPRRPRPPAPDRRCPGRTISTITRLVDDQPLAAAALVGDQAEIGAWRSTARRAIPNSSVRSRARRVGERLARDQRLPQATTCRCRARAPASSRRQQERRRAGIGGRRRCRRSPAAAARSGRCRRGSPAAPAPAHRSRPSRRPVSDDRRSVLCTMSPGRKPAAYMARAKRQ